MIWVIKAVPPGTHYSLGFNYYGRSGGCSRGFHLDFPHIIVLTPWVRESIWEFFQLVSISILTIYSESWEITIGCVLSPNVRHVQAQTPIYRLNTTGSLLSVDSSDYSSCLGISIPSEPVSNNPQKVLIFPFPEPSYSDKLPQDPWRKIHDTYLWLHCRILPQSGGSLWTGLWLETE